jgi:hypothetical protein
MIDKGIRLQPGPRKKRWTGAARYIWLEGWLPCDHVGTWLAGWCVSTSRLVSVCVVGGALFLHDISSTQYPSLTHDNLLH